jgi:hypothetical protein
LPEWAECLLSLNCCLTVQGVILSAASAPLLGGRGAEGPLQLKNHQSFCPPSNPDQGLQPGADGSGEGPEHLRTPVTGPLSPTRIPDTQRRENPIKLLLNRYDPDTTLFGDGNRISRTRFRISAHGRRLRQRLYHPLSKRGPRKETAFLPLPFLGVASILLGVATALSLSREGEDWTVSIVFFVVGIFWLTWHFIRPLRLRRLFRRDPRFKTPTKVVIDGSEWRVTTATAEARFKHGTFVKAVETGSGFLLYHAPIVFNIVPRRDLTPEQQTQIATFLDRELPVQKGRVRLPATS